MRAKYCFKVFKKNFRTRPGGGVKFSDSHHTFCTYIYIRKCCENKADKHAVEALYATDRPTL